MGALQVLEGLREAQPGEFTRRAFENGRIDLAEAEGLADLLEAETEMQRRAALGLAGGSLSRQIEEWQQSLLVLSARVEAELDFSDEEDVESAPGALPDAELRTVREGIRRALASPPAERLRDGIRVTVAGPPNAGKSSLINYLAQREVAITSTIAGTTRDVIEAPIAIRGIPLVLADTAGLRSSQDEIEAIGIGRARQMLEAADLILWLGSPEDKPRQQRIITVHPKADLDGAASPGADVSVSATTGDGMDKLVEVLVEQCKGLLPGDDDLSINTRHRQHLHECLAELDSVSSSQDPLITAEHLRRTRLSLDRITGRAGVEEMLNMLFGRFCIGK
jgi:tRNA modification GTPase